MRKHPHLVIWAVLLAVCLLVSGCTRLAPAALPTAAPMGEQPTASDTPTSSHSGQGSSKRSAQDEAFLQENDYLTHHTSVAEDTMQWHFEEATGTLRIEGSGMMKDYLQDDPAWLQHKDAIREVVLADGITSVGDYAFYDCAALTTVKLPDSIEYIGEAAFAYAYQLADIPFPAALREIAAWAFAEVKVHKPLHIPNGVEIIAAGAFHANDFWDTITLPASLYYLQEGAFSNSLHVHDFVVDEANQYYTAVDGVLYDRAMTVLLAYPMLKETVDFTIPASVTRIGDNAFDINFFTRTLTIPASVTQVGESQFGLLRQLQRYQVDAGSTLFKTDGDALLSQDGRICYAYPALAAAAEYTLPAGVDTVLERAFAECWYLQKLYLPTGVRVVGTQAFFDMNGTHIYLPESFPDTVTEIDSTCLYSEAQDDGWDLHSGFTYVPNAQDCVVAHGRQASTRITVHYAGSWEKWNQFVTTHNLYLGDTAVLCEP